MLKEEMQQIFEKKDPLTDKLGSVGSVRKDKELRQLQGECELLKTEVDKLKSENEVLRSRSSPSKADLLPIAVKDEFTGEAAEEEDKGRTFPEQNMIEQEAAGSLGNSTLKSSLSELTKSQKLVIENVRLSQFY